MNKPQFTFATSVESPPAMETSAAASASTTEASVPHKHHLVYPTVLDTARSLLSIIVIALFVLTFVVQPFRIPSESM